MTPRTLALLCFAVGGLGGCASGGLHLATSQPAHVDQLTGAVPVKVEAPVDVNAKVDVPIEGNRLGDYTSEFGAGAAAVVILTALIAWRSARSAEREASTSIANALKIVEHIIDVLRLTLTMSHEREAKRIECGLSHGPIQPECGRKD